MSAGSPITPSVLRWARESANLSRDEVAKKASIGDTKKGSGASRIEAWEDGDGSPTLPQLERLARVYRRPLVTFYLPGPPKPADSLPDFRSSSMGERSPEFEALMRHAQARQQSIRDLVQDDDLWPELDFLGTARSTELVSAVANRMRAKLQVSIDEQRRQGSPEKLFAFLRQAIERVGVFVTLQGNTGSHHSAVSPQEFRGLVIADDIAPLIVINPKDYPAARNFTLIHELAHLWLGESAISNTNPFEKNQDQPTEIFCNKVAAEFLMPLAQVRKIADTSSQDSKEELVQRVSKEFSVSKTAAALRLWKIGLITEDQWWGIYQRQEQKWKIKRAKQKERGGAPSGIQVKASYLGPAVLRSVFNATAAGELSFTRAARILQIKPSSLAKYRKYVA